jgi:hypothetical protein
MKRDVLRHGARVALALAFTVTLLAQPSFAAEFFAIVDNFGRRARNVYLDVAVDHDGSSAPPEVLFNVYNTVGSQIAEFSVLTQEGFASTASFGNLFGLTGGRPMLIRARTPSALDSGAVLHIDSQGAPMTVGILPITRLGTVFGMERLFSAPLGNFRSASLLIANVWGDDVSVDIFKGAKGPDGSGINANPRLANYGIWRVDLTQNEALSNVIVSSSGSVIVQAVIDDGRGVQSYMVPPSS